MSLIAVLDPRLDQLHWFIAYATDLNRQLLRYVTIKTTRKLHKGLIFISSSLVLNAQFIGGADLIAIISLKYHSLVLEKCANPALLTSMWVLRFCLEQKPGRSIL